MGLHFELQDIEGICINLVGQEVLNSYLAGARGGGMTIFRSRSAQRGKSVDVDAPAAMTAVFPGVFISDLLSLYLQNHFFSPLNIIL